MSIRISRSDIIWNYLGNIMTLGANLFLLPFILRYLSGDELGLWYTFSAVGNIAVLFDFGFKATMGRNVTFAWCGASELQRFDAKEIPKGLGPNFILMNKIMVVSKYIYLIISFAALIVFGSIGTIYIKKVSLALPFNNVMLAWAVYIVGTFFNLYYGYYNAFLSGVGAIKQVNIAIVLSRAVQLLVAFTMLKLGYGLLSMSVAYCIFCVVFRLLATWFFFKYEGIGAKIRGIKEKLNYSEIISIFKIVWHNAWRDGIVSFTSFLNGQATTLLCSWFISLEYTAVYGLSMQIVNATASIAAIYFSTFQSRMQELYIERDYENLRKRLSTTLLVYMIVFIVGAICVCTFGLPMLLLIKSNTEINLPLLIILFIYMLFYKNHNLFASYLAGTNRIIYTKAYIVSSLAMVGLSSIMLELTNLGIWVLAISPLVIECLYNNWHWPYLVLEELHLSYSEVINLGLKQLKEDICR